VAEVLDDLLGLAVTLGAVDGLKGMQCVPGDVVVDGAVVVPGGNTSPTAQW
jgi:hypothetical protein